MKRTAPKVQETKKAPSPQTAPSPLPARLDVLRADLAAVKNWVALEEKIVHNYREQKAPLFKSLRPLPIASRPEPVRPEPAALKINRGPQAAHTVFLRKIPGSSFLRSGLTAVKKWFATGETAIGKAQEPKITRSKSPVPSTKVPPAELPKADLTAIKERVEHEEKIVREYKEQKIDQAPSILSLPKTPAKPFLPSLKTTRPPAAFPLSFKTSRLKDLWSEWKEIFLRINKLFWTLGWLAAAALVLLNLQQAVSSHATSQRLWHLKAEKDQLHQSYMELQNLVEDQRTELNVLNSELQDTTSKLKAANFEINTLRSTVANQSDIIKALKAQSQAFENIIDQGGMSALSGAAAGFSSGQFSTGRSAMFQGEVTAVNSRRGFVVVNMGADQGAYPGRWITISRGDRGVAVGHIDRVYPTMSVAVLRNVGMLQAVQEGDSAFFS